MLDIIDHSGIREICLARPPVNALDGELLRQLVEAITSAHGSDALVISGQPGMFSAGLDVPGMLTLDRSGLAEVFLRLWHAQRAIATSPRPVIFGLTGHCPAGGTVLAIHGDYRVMAQNSAGAEFRMGLNEVQVGLFPGPDPRRVPSTGRWSRGPAAHTWRTHRSGDRVARRAGRRGLRRDALCGPRARGGARVLRAATRTHAAHARARTARSRRVVR